MLTLWADKICLNILVRYTKLVTLISCQGVTIIKHVWGFGASSYLREYKVLLFYSKLLIEIIIQDDLMSLCFVSRKSVLYFLNQAVLLPLSIRAISRWRRSGEKVELFWLPFRNILQRYRHLSCILKCTKPQTNTFHLYSQKWNSRCILWFL